MPERVKYFIRRLRISLQILVIFFVERMYLTSAELTYSSRCVGPLGDEKNRGETNIDTVAPLVHPLLPAHLCFVSSQRATVFVYFRHIGIALAVGHTPQKKRNGVFTIMVKLFYSKIGHYFDLRIYFELKE